MPLVGRDDSRGTTNRIWALVVSLCALTYAGWMFAQELRARSESAESLRWPGVSGEITTAKSRTTTRRRGGICTSSEICFRYAVGGTPYTSCRASFFKSCSASTAAGLMTQFPIGAEVTVFYDPRAPGEAVLVPGSWNRQSMLRFWPLLIATLALTAAFHAWRLLRPPEAEAAIADPPGGAPQV